MKFYEDPVYIKMCEKAKPFWTKEFLMDLDYHTFWAQKHYGEWAIDIRGCIPREDVPLLRQDQLIEMIGSEQTYRIRKFNSGWNLFDCFPGEKFTQKFLGNSLEKVLLRFLMKLKFNKTWDNNSQEWVNAN